MSKSNPIRWLLLFLLCFVMFYSGYLFNELTDKNEYDYDNMPSIPRLPSAAPAVFKGNDFEDLNMSGSRRNEYLCDFHTAWKEKKVYGLYETGYGLDDLVHTWWLTKDGEIHRFCISDHGTPMIKKAYYYDKSDSLSIYCWMDKEDGTQQITDVEPDTIKDKAYYISGNFKKENRIFLRGTNGVK